MWGGLRRDRRNLRYGWHRWRSLSGRRIRNLRCELKNLYAAVSPFTARGCAGRKRTATSRRIVRTCGESIRSSTPSPTDLMSARIMPIPTRPPCGNDRQEDRYAPIFQTALITIQCRIAAERIDGFDNNIVLVGPESAFAQPKYIGLLVVD